MKLPSWNPNISYPAALAVLLIVSGIAANGWVNYTQQIMNEQSLQQRTDHEYRIKVLEDEVNRLRTAHQPRELP